MESYYLKNDIGIICTPTFITAEYLYSILHRNNETIKAVYYISDPTNLIKVICGQLGIDVIQINYYDFKKQLDTLYVFTDGVESAGFKLLIDEFKTAGKDVHIFKTAFIEYIRI